MPNCRKYILYERPGDREIIQDYIARFEQFDHQTLVDKYNAAWKTGIVGVHQQALNYYAMHIVFTRVFGKSPITLEDNVCLGLTDPISYENNTWVYQYSQSEN